MNRRILQRLNSQEYEHSFDRKALENLKKTKGFDTFVKAFYKYWMEKVYKMQFTGSNIRVTEESFPEVNKALHNACEILEMNYIPKLYIQYDYSVNAFVAGIEDPIIVLNTGCLDLLTEEELMFLIGHELGHIKSNHVLYHQMGYFIPYLGSMVGYATLGIGKLIITGIELALLNWQRMSEFTADRAGLLTCQNIDAATTASMKIAGLPLKYYNQINIEAFKRQAKEFEAYDYDKLDKLVKLISTLNRTHPWTIMRAAEFYQWQDNGSYDKILKRHWIKDTIIICEKCNQKMKIPTGRGVLKAKCPQCQHTFHVDT
ncbi:Zn-dependent protease with chaperone function [Natronincola peptidivorans]|uniref:Zn-dependent protease with chaperone function n=1 Tax=Natronincola peptidivorans TaxID=426128 RepID=A0A1H9ZUE4_9FIRM|nr:M48 family metalloprotease [Natronincola peptidivorans]SES85377.1 Zn-dependent protease with chaperone function [Natronincola peptidivorans]